MLRRLTFSLWYFFHPPWDTGISPPELLEFLSNHPAGRAIDIGCGTGTNVITMARHGWQVTGIDFAAPAIQMAKRKIARTGIHAHVSVGDATDLKEVAGPFDFALDIGCFHGIPERARYLAELSRVLAPGGYWLMYGRFKADPAASSPGLTQADIDLIPSFGLRQINRTDGVDRHDRPSAWFLYQR